MSFDPPPLINSNPYYIFPNPAEGYIYFYRDHVGEAHYQLEIYDAIGKRVRQFNCYNDYKKIDLSKITKTYLMYFLKEIAQEWNYNWYHSIPTNSLKDFS